MDQQQSNTNISRNDSLLQAIDFFTQKFNLNQLSNYALDFTHKTLCLHASALFVLEADHFVLVRTINYTLEKYSIKNTSALQRIATFHGSIMTSGFDSYFDPQDTDKFDTQLIIPLIIKDMLYGFILSDGKVENCLCSNDLVMSKALMQLINNSLESSKNFSDLQLTNNQLDQKVFNLFSINQSSRILLSELDLNKLYSLAIDIFSELTSSQITSFGLYDEITGKIVLRGYRDVFSRSKRQIDFELLDTIYKGYKVVFHYEQDKELLKSIFKNYEDFKQLEAEYIILIVKDKVLGFVTISKTVNDRAYDQSIFELIESLAASAYISFKNAMYFDEISRNRKIVEQKLQILTNLNTLIRNINSCVTLDELCDISIKTLHYSFGFNKALIALKENDSYIIKNHVGFQPTHFVLDTNDNWANIGTDSFVSFLADQTGVFFSTQLASEIGTSNCLVISPINIGNTDIEDNTKPLGYIVIMQTPHPLKEEEALLIETMTNSIAPIVNHLIEMSLIKKSYVIDQKQAFVNSIRTKYTNKNKYFIDFYIYYKKIPQNPFEEANLSQYEDYEYYYFNNLLAVISYDILSEHDFDGCIEAADAEEAINNLRNACKHST